MKGPRSLFPFAAAGFGWLALFALLFTIGAALSLWPSPTVGGFHGSDLVVGFVFGVVLLAYLAVGRKP